VHDLVTTHAWRESKAGKKIEKNRASYDEALCVAEVLANEGGLEIRKSALMVDGDRAFPFLPVSSFRVGMEVPSYDGEAVVTDTIVEIVRLEAEPQTVWDLSVPEYRNFVADGVVVHNSIYAFRAANVENILTFEQRWPGCQTFYISSNYRSTPQIVAVGNSLIAKNSRQLPYVAQTPNANGMKPMVIRSENDGEQDRDIVEKITFYHEEHNVPYDEMMVLMRQNRQSIMLERDLVRAGIPYYKRGPQFWRSQHMKMVLAWVKLLQNPMEKLALARVVALYPGLGKKAIDDASKAIEKPEDFDRFMRGEIALGKAAGWLKCQEDLREIVEAYRSGAPRCLQESLGRLRAVAEPFILDMEKADSRLADVDTMLALAEGFEKVEDLLEEIALQDESSGSKENRVLLSTIHGVKGLECRIGFIMGMNEEIFPGNVTSLADLEEERRLAYVGITRPKEILIMYAPLMQTGTAGRKPGELTPSRFLDEIDPDLLIVKGTVS
jgi:DNA helicase-2/ATP-dependent DNA helicase PcrA